MDTDGDTDMDVDRDMDVDMEVDMDVEGYAAALLPFSLPFLYPICAHVVLIQGDLCYKAEPAIFVIKGIFALQLIENAANGR